MRTTKALALGVYVSVCGCMGVADGRPSDVGTDSDVLGDWDDGDPSPSDGAPSDTDLGDSDAGGDDGELPPEGSVPMFIASGNGGRRLVSCDDGLTWMDTCTTDDGELGTCRKDESDDGHAPWSATGLAYGNGVFLAMYNWFGADAPSAYVLRTRDGRHWELVFGGEGMNQGTYGNGISYGNGVFAIAAQRSGTHRSTNDGDDWVTTTFAGDDRPHRRVAMFIPYRGGRFIATGDAGRVTYSDDDAATWTDIDVTSCPYMDRIYAWGGGVLLAKNDAGLCASTDGGLTWSTRLDYHDDTEDYFGGGGVVWTGTDFLISRAYTNDVFRTVNGTSVMKVSVTGTFGGSNGWPALMALGDSGTLVGASADGGKFFRSTDHGASWTSVDGFAGTSLYGVVFGYGAASEDCPAP